MLAMITLLRNETDCNSFRLFEDEVSSVIDVRTETLQTLRELGPPDLVHLIKQPVKSNSKQVGANEIRAYRHL